MSSSPARSDTARRLELKLNTEWGAWRDARMGGRAREGSDEERPGTDRHVFAGGRLDLLADDAAAEAVRVREGP